MLRAALVAVLLLAALPGATRAATVSLRSLDAGAGSGRVLAIDDPAGQPNAIDVRLRGRSILVRDAAAELVAARGCRRAADGGVRCAVSAARGDEDRDFVVLVTAALGAGDDVLRASGALGRDFEDISALVGIDGGPGNDRIDASGLLGPRLPGDGARLPEFGLPSLLSGGDGDDELLGAGSEDVLAGGPGHDVLRGGPGGDRLDGDGTFDLRALVAGTDDEDDVPAPTPAEPDVLEGGSGRDHVSYAGRRAPVAVDLTAGTGGSVGEGDALRSVEGAEGGEAASVLRGTTGRNRLVARVGDAATVLEGGAGDDELDAHGAGRLLGGAGDDVLADVGAVLPACGSGRDVVVPSPGAVLDARRAGDCERAQVERLVQVLLAPGVRVADGRVALTQRLGERFGVVGRADLPGPLGGAPFELTAAGRPIARGRLDVGARGRTYALRAPVHEGAETARLVVRGRTPTDDPGTTIQVLLAVVGARRVVRRLAG